MVSTRSIAQLLVLGLVTAFGASSSNVWATPTVGACCLPTGACEVVPETVCAQWGGVFQGADVPCSPDPCAPPPPPTGACCVDYVCTVTTRVECLGEYFGDATLCDPTPCPPPPPPTGACCLPTGECVTLTQEECAEAEGEYQGDRAGCDPETCPQPLPTEPSTWGTIKARYR